MSRREATFTAYVRRYGKVTVPKGVRDALDVGEGDLVECKIWKIKGRKAK